MKRTWKILSLLLVLAMLLPLLPQVRAQEQHPVEQLAEPLAWEPEQEDRVRPQATAVQQHPGKEEIAAKWATVTDATSLYDQEPVVSAPYEAGKLSDNFLESGITYLNYVRFVAGLPAVALDDTLIEDAQHGAVLLAAVDTLTHTPGQPEDMDDEFYLRGYNATSSSNISARWGYAPLTCIQGSIQGCMNDNGNNNLLTVGHRRWFLNPTLGKVGFGYAQSAEDWSYIVTPVFDRSGAGCDYDFISWPVSGNHPTNLFDIKNPWSVTLNPRKYRSPDADSVKITITRTADGKQWSFDSTTGQPSTHTSPYMIVNKQGYGVSNCIIFHPGSVNVDSYTGVFQVNITGIYYSDGTAAELNYEVDFFDVTKFCIEHSYEAVVTEPTCQAIGYTTYTCTNCGDSYVTDYTIPVDHRYEDGVCIWCGDVHHGFEYTLETDTQTGEQYAVIQNYTGKETILLIPAVLDGYPVRKIGAKAFFGNETLVNVLIPEGVEDIGGQAFSKCYNLEVITIPGTVRQIGEAAFKECESLKSIVIPHGVTQIKAETFWGCYSLESISIPDTVQYIGESAFFICVNLGKIEIPHGVAAIEAYTFSGCTSLTGITIPDTVTSIGKRAFRSCEQLESVIIPDSVTSIGELAFESCYRLRSVKLSKNLEDTGNQTFYNCIMLTEVEIPEGITKIGPGTFYGCERLETIILPKSITTIAEEAFYSCDALEKIAIPAAVESIGSSAFSYCGNLAEIQFSGDAPAIGQNAFNNVSATVYYPAGNDTWTADVMQPYGGTLAWTPVAVEIASGWSGATQWTLMSDGTLTIYGKGDMKNYGFGGDHPWKAYVDRIRTVDIEEGITSIGTGAFRGLTRLESVTLPESGLKKIGEAAFYGCSALKEINIPEGIYTVWSYTFKGCTSLESVKLPKTLIKIDQGAFENCTALTYVYFPTNLEIIGSWSFKGCTGLTEANMTWTDATKIREGAFKNCSSLTTIHLPVNIQVLGDSCFYGIGATSFTVPETVTSIEAWCFARAYSLKDLYFEGNAPTIGEGAFNKITLTAWYPSGNATWKPAIMQNYGGTVTWKAN